ncbi:MAG TPA: MBL fold metallo-hydrolase [Acidimicrobiales bacterium]|nr:MBL fold metallo-hydrolase [Acidimicrobiales bacterium]
MTAPDHAPAPPHLEEVAPHVFAYVQPDGSWWINNTGFLAGSDATTVIDMTSTETRSRAFLDEVHRHSAGPVRTLINTHAHGDHTHGNYLTVPAATIVGHERCRATIQAMGVAGPVIDALFPGVEWGDLAPAPPFLTFTDRVNLYVDELLVELVHLGPAHTDNDVIAWIPEHRVLFAGDLVFNGGQPNNVGGSIQGTLDALDALEALQPAVVVPGHGELCDATAFDELREYLRFVQQVARDAAASGTAPLDAARSVDAGRFGEWLDPERLVGNLHCAMAEASGRPVDMAAAFGDMVTFNGGPLRCVA